MDKTLSITKTISIHASAERVWEVLTSPELIKEYLFGTNTETDWKKGSSIRFTGEWEGKEYEDKGKILEVEKPRHLSYSYWSSFSGLEDIPENYSVVSMKLSGEGQNIVLTVEQQGFSSQETQNHSDSNWASVLESIKQIAER